MIEVHSIPYFDKAAKRLGKKYRSLAGELKLLQEELRENPYLGTDLGDNVRKIRLGIASKGKGKRGGARADGHGSRGQHRRGTHHPLGYLRQVRTREPLRPGNPGIGATVPVL